MDPIATGCRIHGRTRVGIRFASSVLVAGALLSRVSAALAQPDPGQAGSHAQSLTPPVLHLRAEAIYPPEALRERLEASVGLEVVVDENGRVTDARVTAPAGHGFDEAALDAVRRFTFEPARKNGVAIRSNVELGYDFRLPAAAQPAATASPPPIAEQAPSGSTLVVAEAPRPATVAPFSSSPEPVAASQSSTSRDQISLLPKRRAVDLFDVVPGLFTMRNAGGGKAQQEFARGFQLDHGTDMAFFFDDVPINAVSHAHGQGYSDVNFIIVETVDRVDSSKGTYATDVGDFGTAGSATFRMADHLDESLAKFELAPSIGRQRAVVAESPDFGDRWRVLVAAEAFHEDGPYIHPEDYQGLNGYVKATRVLDGRSELSLTATAYSSSWNMSGLLPARAVCGEGDGTPTPAAYAGSHCIDRFDSLDPSQGGGAQRVMAAAQYRRQLDEHWDVKASAYTLHSNLQIFPNDGVDAPFQPDGMLYGSQIEQDDTRTQSGGQVALTHRDMIAGIPVHTRFGLQIRNDDIHNELHRTEDRKRLDGIDVVNIPGPKTDDQINETETGLYVEEDFRPARWLRFLLGARGDRVDAAVDNLSQTAIEKVSGILGQMQLSPKASAIVSPLPALDLFADYGRGFHTNDSRTIVSGATTTLIVPALGYEVGTTVRPVKGLSLSAAGYILDLASELTIDGDTASTSPSGQTRRYGVELMAHYQIDRRLYADMTFTAAHSRFTDAADVASGTVYVPDAPIRTFSASLGGRQPVGPVMLSGAVTVRSISDRYGDSGPTPLVETGWTVVDAQAGARWKGFELGVDLFNVADTVYRGGQVEVASRLPGENNPPPAGISFTPGLPRTLMGRAALYW